MGDNDLANTGAPIAALVADLMFASRVRGVASEAKTVHNVDGLLAAVGTGTRLILVDLHARGALDAIRRLADLESKAPVVAFGSHVNTEALQAARDAGADRVMARSAFVRELPALVRDASA